MRLSSPAFGPNEPIPTRFTCDGDGRSPELHWSDLPAGTASLVLTVLDPDVPFGVFVHWTIWRIDPLLGSIGEGQVPDGARQGLNGFGATGWAPPCPPPGDGTHRYHFDLFALRDPLDLAPGASIEAVHQAMEGDIIARAELIGTYQRTRRAAP